MMLTQVLSSTLVDALLARGIAFISRRGVPYLAGLLALFPAFALFAHIKAFDLGGSLQVKQVAIFGLVALLPYAGYLLTIIFQVTKVDLKAAMVAAIGEWIVLALAGIVFWDALIAPYVTHHACDNSADLCVFDLVGGSKPSAGPEAERPRRSTP